MIKFALTCTLLAGAIWFAGFYKMGEKPLVGHLEEIYGTPLVQQKVDAFQRGLGSKIHGGSNTVVVEKQKKSPRPRPMAAVEQPPEPAVIDARPHTGQQQKAPAHDDLTQEDREDLNELVAKKLKK